MDKKTFEQWATENLVSYGLFDKDATEILELAKNDNVLASMSGRWTDDINGYPSAMLAALWLPIKRIAFEWLNTNSPLAWNKSLFE